jgi:hypothetical protein
MVESLLRAINRKSAIFVGRATSVLREIRAFGYR